nr:YifB family Mg chelatase-like AAA ATPase [Nesterenkonia sp. NBAIMH1]
MGRARGAVVIGAEGRLIEVEADIGQSLPSFVLLGLPDAALRESQDRVRSAAKNAGLSLPARRLTVNLFPASLPKAGSGLDLAILVSAWAADGKVSETENVLFMAELGLDGRLRPVRGVLPAAAAAVHAGLGTIVVAQENAAEAALVPGAEVLSADHVLDVAAAFRSPSLTGAALEGTLGISRLVGGVSTDEAHPAEQLPDLSEVRGQLEARFALEAAAAGGHNMLLLGPPGAGKTMLAERLPSILPPLTDEHAMEATAIASVSSAAQAQLTGLQRTPPFEAPHHSASAAAIIGGGTGMPTPGAVTRAHRGVLFLDEAPEFQRHVLDSLRQPIETGRIALQRSAGQVIFPAQFQLVLAANPCPCGMNSGRGLQCTCTVAQRRGYLRRISGPMLDRIDLQVRVERPRSSALALAEPGETSAQVLARVRQARARQRERLAPYGLQLNSQVSLKLLSDELRMPRPVTAQLDAALDRALISLRGYVRILRLAWTLADTQSRDEPAAEDIDAAMQLRLSAGDVR